MSSELLFISVFNYGCIEIAHNHLASLKQNNINNYMAYVTDIESRDYLSSLNYNVELVDDNIFVKEKCDFATKSFNNLSYLRYKIIAKLLQENKTIWYLDVDTVVLYDLNKYFNNEIDKNFDILFQDDINMYCTGCMLLQPKQNNIQLCQVMYQNMNMDNNDQIVLRNILRSNPNFCNTKTLDILKFPNGLLYFRELQQIPNWRKLQEDFRNNPNALFVHANWMVGVDTKINALKSKQLWFIL